jgi:magnesium-transporting ATPase (P-type)
MESIQPQALQRARLPSMMDLGHSVDSFRSVVVDATGSSSNQAGGAKRSGKANEITTTKYSLLSWLPVSFMYQFRRIANVYFLVISAFMIIGTYFPWIFVSPLEPLSTILTLAVVMMVTSLKEGADDYARYKSDREENESEVTLMMYDKAASTWGEERVHSKVVQPGDIIKLSGKTRIPVDMVLLMTSTYLDGNSCYVETSNIDGETNLKVKAAPPRTAEVISMASNGATDLMQPPPELFDMTIEFEDPNKSIYTFVGALHLGKSAAAGAGASAGATGNAGSGSGSGGDVDDDDDAVPLGADNLLLRSSVFSNTDWAYGVALYTGQYTKVQMNNSLPPAKMSNFEKYANKAVAGVFCAQCVMVVCAVIAFYSMGFDQFEDKLPYVYPTGNTAAALPFWLEQCIVFFILFNNFIPISLYVTMELTNLGQSDMIRYDTEMYDEDMDKPCVVKSGNLMQELGQISQIFSDKTGTLTRNEMKLMCTVAKGHEVDMTLGDEGLPSELASGNKRRDFYAFLECLLLCHTVVREKTSKDDPAAASGAGVGKEGNDDNDDEAAAEKRDSLLRKTYRAESPDELALIMGTLPFNCNFNDRQSAQLYITVDSEDKRFEQLAVNAFNADRKRMSVVVRMMLYLLLVCDLLSVSISLPVNLFLSVCIP